MKGIRRPVRVRLLAASRGVSAAMGGSVATLVATAVATAVVTVVVTLVAVTWMPFTCAAAAGGGISAAGSGKKVTITWMHWNTGTRWAEYEKWVNEFEKTNPDIDVVPQQLAWEQIAQKVTVGVAGGSAPDVVSVSSTWGESMAEQNVLLDLRPFIEKDRAAKVNDLDDIFPSALKLWQDAFGRQYAFPHDLDLALVFYNEDLFDVTGLPAPTDKWTWNDMLDIGKKFLKDVNGDGKYDQFAYSSWFADWYPYIWANGGEILTPDLKGSALGSTAARQALEWFGQFYPNRLHLMPSAVEAANPSVLFMNGKIAMQPAGAWYGAYMIEQKAGFSFDVAHMPISYAGKRATLLAGQGMAITVTSKHPEEAYRFITYMASREPQAALGSTQNQTPVRKSVALSRAFVNPEVPPKNKIAFVIALEGYARGDYKTAHWSKILAQLRSTFNRYFTGLDSLDTALTKFAEQVKAITK